MQLKTKGLQNFAGVGGGAAVLSATTARTVSKLRIEALALDWQGTRPSFCPTHGPIKKMIGVRASAGVAKSHPCVRPAGLSAGTHPQCGCRCARTRTTESPTTNCNVGARSRWHPRAATGGYGDRARSFGVRSKRRLQG